MEFPDPLKLKEEFEKKQINWKDLEPKFREVISNTNKFPSWEPQTRLANAIMVAAFLRAQELKTNQVRKILDMAREIRLKTQRGEDIGEDLIRMRFMLAYIVGKAHGKDRYALEAFYKVLEPMLRLLTENPSAKVFGGFYEFLEAVIAYHRFFGGREK